MSFTSTPLQPMTMARPRPTQRNTNPKSRDSNALRASVWDAALQLGFGADSVVADWIFSNPLKEEDEDQIPSSPGLTNTHSEESTATSPISGRYPPTPSSPSSNGHYQSTVPFALNSSSAESSTANVIPKISIPSTYTNDFESLPSLPQPPRSGTPSKLKKKKKDGYESDGGGMFGGKDKKKKDKDKKSKDKGKEAQQFPTIPGLAIFDTNHSSPVPGSGSGFGSGSGSFSTSTRPSFLDLPNFGKEESRKRNKSLMNMSAPVSPLGSLSGSTNGNGYETDGHSSKSSKVSKKKGKWSSSSKKSTTGGGVEDEKNVKKSKSLFSIRIGGKSSKSDLKAEKLKQDKERDREFELVREREKKEKLVLPIAQMFTNGVDGDSKLGLDFESGFSEDMFSSSSSTITTTTAAPNANANANSSIDMDAGSAMSISQSIPPTPSRPPPALPSSVSTPATATAVATIPPHPYAYTSTPTPTSASASSPPVSFPSSSHINHSRPTSTSSNNTNTNTNNAAYTNATTRTSTSTTTTSTTTTTNSTSNSTMSRTSTSTSTSNSNSNSNSQLHLRSIVSKESLNGNGLNVNANMGYGFPMVPNSIAGHTVGVILPQSHTQIQNQSQSPTKRRVIPFFGGGNDSGGGNGSLRNSGGSGDSIESNKKPVISLPITRSLAQVSVSGSVSGSGSESLGSAGVAGIRTGIRAGHGHGNIPITPQVIITPSTNTSFKNRPFDSQGYGNGTLSRQLSKSTLSVSVGGENDTQTQTQIGRSPIQISTPILTSSSSSSSSSIPTTSTSSSTITSPTVLRQARSYSPIPGNRNGNGSRNGNRSPTPCISSPPNVFSYYDIPPPNPPPSSPLPNVPLGVGVVAGVGASSLGSGMNTGNLRVKTSNTSLRTGGLGIGIGGGGGGGGGGMGMGMAVSIGSPLPSPLLMGYQTQPQLQLQSSPRIVTSPQPQSQSQSQSHSHSPSSFNHNILADAGSALRARVQKRLSEQEQKGFGFGSNTATATATATATTTTTTIGGSSGMTAPSIQRGRNSPFPVNPVTPDLRQKLPPRDSKSGWDDDDDGRGSVGVHNDTKYTRSKKDEDDDQEEEEEVSEEVIKMISRFRESRIEYGVGRIEDEKKRLEGGGIGGGLRNAIPTRRSYEALRSVATISTANGGSGTRTGTGTGPRTKIGMSSVSPPGSLVEREKEKVEKYNNAAIEEYYSRSITSPIPPHNQEDIDFKSKSSQPQSAGYGYGFDDDSDDDASYYPDDEIEINLHNAHVPGSRRRSTLYLDTDNEAEVENQDKSRYTRNSRWSGISSYSRGSFLNVERSEEVRERFVQGVEAMLDERGGGRKEVKGLGNNGNFVPPVPKLPMEYMVSTTSVSGSGSGSGLGSGKKGEDEVEENGYVVKRTVGIGARKVPVLQAGSRNNWF